MLYKHAGIIASTLTDVQTLVQHRMDSDTAAAVLPHRPGLVPTCRGYEKAVFSYGYLARDLISCPHISTEGTHLIHSTRSRDLPFGTLRAVVNLAYVKCNYFCRPFYLCNNEDVSALSCYL